MGKTSIVLLPGLDGTGQLFARFIVAAPPQFAVTSIALPPEALSYNELADHVARNLPVGEPVVVIAESFSGPVALALEVRRPVAALVLCNSFVAAPRWRPLRWFIWPVFFGLPLPRFLVRRYMVGEAAEDAVVDHVAEVPKPIVLLLQGSGCAPSFTVDGHGTYHPTNLFQDVVAAASRRVHFAVVEKPGVATLKLDAAMNQEEKLKAFELAGLRCSQEFFENATKTVRVDDVRVAMAALAGQPWASGFILVGHSEGTHVATGVLKSRPAEPVLAAALFASAGPTPFWSGYVSDGGTRAGFERAFNRVRMLHAAERRVDVRGPPGPPLEDVLARGTPLDDVRESMVPLFVAHGTRDGTILAHDLFVIEALRQQPTRSLRYVVLENGDHAFETAPGQSRIPETFNDFLDWALDTNRATGTAVLH